MVEQFLLFYFYKQDGEIALDISDVQQDFLLKWRSCVM